MRWAEKGLRIWALVGLIGVICIAWALYRKEGFQIQSVDEINTNKYNPKIAALQKQLEAYKGQQPNLQAQYNTLTNQTIPPLIDKTRVYYQWSRVEPSTLSANNLVIYTQIMADKKSLDDAQSQKMAIEQQMKDLQKSIDDTSSQLNAITGEFANVKATAATPAAARTTACTELLSLRTALLSKIADVRVKMNDLSGTEVLGVALKDENLRYQYRYATSCDSLVNSTQGTGLTDVAKNSCIGLASQDDPLFNNVLPAYDTTNTELYKQDLTLGDTVQVINDTITLLQCDISGIEYNADDDIGTINVDEIQAKLNELSPYYISSGTLDYVTKYLVGNGILDTALYSSTQILREVNDTLTKAKVLSDKIFA